MGMGYGYEVAVLVGKVWSNKTHACGKCWETDRDLGGNLMKSVVPEMPHRVFEL